MGGLPQGPGVVGAGLCHFPQRLEAEMSGLLIRLQIIPGSTHTELNPELKFSTCSGLEGQTELFSSGIKRSLRLAWEVRPEQFVAEQPLADGLSAVC